MVTAGDNDIGIVKRFWERLVLHTGGLEHVRPFTTGPVMAVFEVLSEVISAEELLRLVAFAKLVNVIEVLSTLIPLRRIGKFFAAISTCIGVGTV